MKKETVRIKPNLGSMKSKKKKIFLGQELYRSEENRLLKKVMEEIGSEPTPTSSILSPWLALMPIREKIYSLRDFMNDCYFSITVDLNRRNKYFLPIKFILREFKSIDDYKDLIPIDLLRYVVRLTLEKQITELLDGKKEKLKYKEIIAIYRERYPMKGDDDLLEKTVCNVWRGDYCDPAELQKTQYAVSEEMSKTQILPKEIVLGDIITGRGVWQVFTNQEQNDFESVMESLLAEKDDGEETMDKERDENIAMDEAEGELAEAPEIFSEVPRADLPTLVEPMESALDN